MDHYLIDLKETNKVEKFNDELKEKYKQYICNKYQDILMYVNENTTSLEIISSIIEWYDTLDYTVLSINFNYYKPALFIAIALNKFDFANLLTENKASIDYTSRYLDMFIIIVDTQIMKICVI